MLKLGTQTGSLVNHLMSGSAGAVPEVGMGCTILLWTDRRPATIVEVNKEKTRIVIQEDDAKRIDKNGMSEVQEWEYTSNPNAYKDTYTLRKDGSYVRLGSTLKDGTRILIGHREKYHDFSF